MNLLIRSVLILFLTGSSYGQKKKETYSFTMKEVLSFKNRIKELEKKDSLNIQLIQKLEDRIRMYKKELGESRTKNDFLLEKNQKVLNKFGRKGNIDDYKNEFKEMKTSKSLNYEEYMKIFNR